MFRPLASQPYLEGVRDFWAWKDAQKADSWVNPSARINPYSEKQLTLRNEWFRGWHDALYRIVR